MDISQVELVKVKVTYPFYRSTIDSNKFDWFFLFE